MAKPTSINISNADTLRVLDGYCKARGISRSSAISTLLDATTPILKDITSHYQLADELNKRLLSGVYKRGVAPRQNTVAAEKYCLEIWSNNLHLKNEYEFDSVNHDAYLRSRKRHHRRDRRLGKIETRHINKICGEFIRREKSPVKYVCFVYVQRVFFPEKEILKKKYNINEKINFNFYSYYHDIYFMPTTQDKRFGISTETICTTSASRLEQKQHHLRSKHPPVHARRHLQSF